MKNRALEINVRMRTRSILAAIQCVAIERWTISLTVNLKAAFLWNGEWSRMNHEYREYFTIHYSTNEQVFSPIHCHLRIGLMYSQHKSWIWILLIYWMSMDSIFIRIYRQEIDVMYTSGLSGALQQAKMRHTIEDC